MGIDLRALVTHTYPPGNMYMPEVRTEKGRFDPPFAPKPYTSLLDDVVATGEAMVERANRDWAAGFPARIKAGQSYAGTEVGGVRVSALSMPEELRGGLYSQHV